MKLSPFPLCKNDGLKKKPWGCMFQCILHRNTELLKCYPPETFTHNGLENLPGWDLTQDFPVTVCKDGIGVAPGAGNEITTEKSIYFFHFNYLFTCIDPPLLLFFFFFSWCASADRISALGAPSLWSAGFSMKDVIKMDVSRCPNLKRTHRLMLCG